MQSVSNTFLSRLEWWLFKKCRCLKLKNRTPSIIADNCNAGIIYHDLGLPFLSPTINLFFMPDDYLRFLKNPHHYLQSVPSEIDDSSVKWPVGILDDVKIHFMHYKSFAEAKEKWLARTQRINFENLYILMSERNGCTHEQIQEFDALPYPRKVIFTQRPYPKIKSVFHIPGFENEPQLGVLTDFRPGFFRRRYLDAFDYVSFLNGDVL